MLEVPRWRGRFRLPEDYPDHTDYIEKRGYDGEGGIIGSAAAGGGGGGRFSRKASMQSTGRLVTPLVRSMNISTFPT